MQKLDIPAQTRLKLTKATPRKETHGKELVQAISLRLEWWPQDNAAVNMLHEGLQDALWWVPPEAKAQAELDGIAPVKKHRRVPTLAMPLSVEAAFSGYTVTIEHGIDEQTELELYACSLDKFKVDAKEGGSVAISWSLASNKQVTPQLVGALCGLEGGEVVATFTPPTAGDAIDGSVEAFQRDHPGADDMFDGDAAGHRDGDDDTSEGGDPDAGDGRGENGEPVRGENWPFPQGALDGSSDEERSRAALAAAAADGQKTKRSRRPLAH